MKVDLEAYENYRPGCIYMDEIGEVSRLEWLRDANKRKRPVFLYIEPGGWKG
jgi:hypothetical protein